MNTYDILKNMMNAIRKEGSAASQWRSAQEEVLQEAKEKHSE